MTLRIAHISDIHFGGENRPAVEAALAAVADLAPALTVVTGDLTLNGLPQEFAAARRWLDLLPGPRLVTPGNHDTPYWNLALRALVPFDRYRRHIGPPEASAWDAPGLVARTLNSARGAQPRPDWSKGALSIRELRAVDWRAGEGALRLFACHHPLIDLPGSPVTGGVHCGVEAASLLAAREVELVLTGHVHVPFAAPLRQAEVASYAMGAGTLSLRTRGFPASFSQVTIEPDAFEVTVQGWTGDRFEPLKTWRLPRSRSGEPPVETPLPPLADEAPTPSLQTVLETAETIKEV
ncbi:MAG: metallophosphoesterase [Caulobacteraceae bacterium]|nr:metallophosphoesterase [Caulobacteraceae bacterium]